MIETSTHTLKDQTIITGYKNDLITNNLRLTGNYYEQGMLDFIKSNIPKGLMIDVGANIGNHTIFFAKYCATKVIAYEPFPSTYSILEKNIIQNNLTNVQLMNLGLGDKAEEVFMISVDGNQGMNKIDSNGDTLIKTVSFDSTAGKHLSDIVTLIKLDCEGYEEKALLGLIKTIEQDHPALFIEAHTEVELNKMKAILTPLKYKEVYRFNHTPTYYFKHSPQEFYS